MQEVRHGHRLRRMLRLGLPAMLLAVPGTIAATAPAALAADPVVAAVGDLGCGPNDASYKGGAGTATDCRQRYVSDLLVGMGPDALLLMGDTQYDEGQLANYNSVFDPTYGQLNDVAYPVPGNVEYGDGTNAGQGFFTYFTNAGVMGRIGAAGDGAHVQQGYYSFDIGNWHIIGLNSNCASPNVGGCAPGSPQETWLKADLAANAAGKCILAYAHHARFNSGSLGDDDRTAPFWTDLYASHADLFLAGHSNHHYERHAPQNPSGNPDANGMREFIVSTGGEHHGTPPATPGDQDTLQNWNYSRFGALKLTLHNATYDWEFVQDASTSSPPSGASFTDSGSGACHTGGVSGPGAPTVTATGRTGAVDLSWTTPSNGGSAITGYRIYRGTTSGSQTLLKTVTGTFSTDSAVTNGTTYYYRLAAVNAIGEGPKSAVVSALPPAPPPPPPVAPPPPPITPPPPPPGEGSSVSGGSTDKAPAELSISRSTIVRASRMLEISGTVTSAATGSVKVSLAGAGQKSDAEATISNHAFRIRKKLPASQAELRTALVTISYPGDDATRRLSVRLRAAGKRSRLAAKRPTLTDGRLRASGTVAANAPGSVQVLLEYVSGAGVKTLRFSAKIAHGAWHLDRTLAASRQSEIGLRTGTLHSYTIYAGSQTAGLDGEMRSYSVLGANPVVAGGHGLWPAAWAILGSNQ
jgi:hypothetical protein